MNILINGKCPECESKNIIEDLEKMESYCADCGLIVANPDFLTFQDIKYIMKQKQKQREKNLIKLDDKSKVRESLY